MSLEKRDTDIASMTNEELVHHVLLDPTCDPQAFELAIRLEQILTSLEEICGSDT